MNAATANLEGLPHWAVMWLLAGGLFLAGKLAMTQGAGLHGWRLAAFTLGWPGMDAAAFLPGTRGRLTGSQFSWAAPALNMLLGSFLLWVVARAFTSPLAAGWVGMVGLILVLHFGLFGLLAAGWNRLGFPVTPIMRCPVAATSLSEFWGRRWNLAFRDITHRLVFRPVAEAHGQRAALWASFAVSGLAHELVISVPAGGGYGLPTAYFLLQAAGMAWERHADRRGHAPRLHRWLRTHAFTALPAIVLFHPPFVERVMVPFFHAIGALP